MDDEPETGFDAGVALAAMTILDPPAAPEPEDVPVDDDTR
jgi:hypothetical protein